MTNSGKTQNIHTLSAEVERLRAENEELSGRLIESGKSGLAEMAKSADLIRENAKLRGVIRKLNNDLDSFIEICVSEMGKAIDTGVLPDKVQYSLEWTCELLTK